MALLAIQVPEDRWIVGIAVIFEANLLGASHQLVGIFRGRRTGHRDTRQITLHVGKKHRDTQCGKAFGDTLQRYRFASSGSACNQSMTIGTTQVECLWNAAILVRRAKADENAVAHASCSPKASGRARRKCCLATLRARQDFRQARPAMIRPMRYCRVICPAGAQARIRQAGRDVEPATGWHCVLAKTPDARLRPALPG